MIVYIRLGVTAKDAETLKRILRNYIPKSPNERVLVEDCISLIEHAEKEVKR